MSKCDKYGEKLEDVSEKIAKGFDRDVDFIPMKEKLIKEFNDKMKLLYESKDKMIKSERRYLINKLNYCLIAMIQLRNGSRISEACLAYRSWMSGNNLDEPIIVKIAKSEKKTKDKKTGEQIKTRARYRKIIFIDWINKKDFIYLKGRADTKKLQKSFSLKKRTLDYLRTYFECNTHSLRYAFINYMLHEKKQEMNTVAKIVGHVNLNMLVKYTQNKNVDKLLFEKI